MLTRRSAIASIGARADCGQRTSFTRANREDQSRRSSPHAVLHADVCRARQGLRKEQGLEIELISAGGSDRVGALVLADGCDFGLAGPEVPMYIYNGESADKPLMFCALTGTDGYFLVSKAKIDKFEWPMLNGKRIMAQRPGSTPELCFEHLLKKNGVNAATIKDLITNVGPAAREGAWLAGGFDFALFLEPGPLEAREGRTCSRHHVDRQGSRSCRVHVVLRQEELARKKNGETAQKWTNAIAKAQDWMKTAKLEEVAQSVTPFFPGITIEDHVAVINRYLNSGGPIWASSTEVDKGGIEKLQELMIEGGVMPADKKVPYDVIVTNEYSTEGASARHARLRKRRCRLFAAGRLARTTLRQSARRSRSSNISLEVEAGEFVAIVGSSGCGKSTLLSLISGLLPVSRGSVMLEGKPVTRAFAARRLHVPEGHAARMAHCPAERAHRAGAARDRQDQGAQARRGAARALRPRRFHACAPEPAVGRDAPARCTCTYALPRTRDSAARRAVLGARLPDPARALRRDRVKSCAPRGKTVILVTHDIGEAVCMAGRVIVMSRRPGRIKSEHRIEYPSFGPGAPDPVRSAQVPRVQRLLPDDLGRARPAQRPLRAGHDGAGHVATIPAATRRRRYRAQPGLSRLSALNPAQHAESEGVAVRHSGRLPRGMGGRAARRLDQPDADELSVGHGEDAGGPDGDGTLAAIPGPRSVRP